SSFTGFGEGTKSGQIIVLNRFRGDKTTLEIGMDNARGGGRLVTGVNCPCACLLFACGEKRAQAKQMIDGANECVHAAIFDTDTAQIFHRFVFAKIDELTFDLRADDHSLSCEMVPRVILDGRDVLRGYSSERSQI